MSLLTYEDALQTLQDFVGGTALARAARDLRRAIFTAYEAFTQEHPWKCYRSLWGFTSSAPYSTGTVSFDLTGGSSERLVTSTGATFPSWAASGSMIVDSMIAEVDRRLGDTTLTLDENLNFGADQGPGDSYELIRDHYTLPEGVRVVDTLKDDVNGYILRYLTPSEFLQSRHALDGSGTPSYYTVMEDPDPENRGRMALYLHPAPDAANVYRAVTIRQPRQMRYTGTESAAKGSSSITVTISNGAAAVTGTGTSFAANMVGSLLRLSPNTSLPTGLDGENPFTEQFPIRIYTSATSITLAANVTQAHTGVNFIVTDPIDIAAHMQPAFLHRCRLELCQSRPDTLGKLLQPTQMAYQQALRLAKSNDNIVKELRVTGQIPSIYDLSETPLGDDDTT